MAGFGGAGLVLAGMGDRQAPGFEPPAPTQGMAGLGQAVLGQARPGEARQGQVRLGKARGGRVEHIRVRVPDAHARGMARQGHH